MNHSDTEMNVGNTSDLKSMFSLRDIYQDEELLCNYQEYSDEDDYNLQYILHQVNNKN